MNGEKFWNGFYFWFVIQFMLVTVKLWEQGLVLSYDGKTWKLHSGKNADVVFEWAKESE